MAMIPELKTAFCGCSLRTGTKVIGWITLVLGLLKFLGISAIIKILAYVVSSTTDEELGEGAIQMLHDSENPEYKNVQGVQSLHSILLLLIGIPDPDVEPEIVGRKLKVELQGILTVAFFIVLVIFLFYVLFTSLLLFGTYKNRSGYVLFYIVLSILGLIAYVPLMFGISASFNSIPLYSSIIAFLIHLYFTWVIYSFYRELRSSSRYPNSMVMLIPEQKKGLDGDVPILSHAVPNDYYYPQK